MDQHLDNSLRGRPLRVLVRIANTLVAAWYLLVSLWLLLGMRTELLTAESYEWPNQAVIGSTIACVLALALLIVNAYTLKKVAMFRISALFILLLWAIQVAEFVARQIHFGSFGSEYQNYIATFLVLGIAVLNVLVDKHKLNSNLG